MLDYLKVANKIIIILLLIFFIFPCFIIAENKNIKNSLKNEYKLTDEIYNDISMYFVHHEPCLEINDKCKVELIFHTNMIFNIVEKKGWIKDENRYIEINIMHDKYGEMYMYVILSLKSHIEDGYYIYEWKLRKNKNYVENDRIFKNSQL